MPDLLKSGGERKFVVLPLKYLFRLRPALKGRVALAAKEIAKMRLLEGKVPCPEYIVINTDEPYAPEVIEIMKRYGHWGPEAGEGGE